MQDYKYRFVIICASGISRSVYENLIQGYDVELKFEKNILKPISMFCASFKFLDFKVFEK